MFEVEQKDFITIVICIVYIISSTFLRYSSAHVRDRFSNVIFSETRFQTEEETFHKN